MVWYSIFSATFNSLEEFSSYATNLSDIVAWTDFERINTTHFWSPMKQIFIKPETRSDFQVLGNRTSFNSMQVEMFQLLDSEIEKLEVKIL